MEREACPHCERLLVPFDGPDDAEILLLGSYPGWEEKEEGIPFIGSTGEVLRYEIDKLFRFKYEDCRTGNLWQHGNVKSCPLRWHRMKTDEEIEKRQYVLMMGAEFGGLYYPGNVTSNNGRKILFPHGGEGIIALNPAIIPKSVRGEFVFALERFADLIDGKSGLGQPAPYLEAREEDDK